MTWICCTGVVFVRSYDKGTWVCCTGVVFVRSYDKGTWVCCTAAVFELYLITKYTTVRNVNKNRLQNYI